MMTPDFLVHLPPMSDAMSLVATLKSKFSPTEWKLIKDDAQYKRVWFFDDTAASNATLYEENGAAGLGLTKA